MEKSFSNDIESKIMKFAKITLLYYYFMTLEIDSIFTVHK